MSKTACFYPIVGAMLGATEYLNTKDWNTINETQAEFLEKFYLRSTAEAASMENIETRASTIASELNDWMKERGFSIQLEDFQDGDFGVVSILDVLVEWVAKGVRRPLMHQGKEYDGVFMKKNFTYFKVKGHDEVVVKLDTKVPGEFVYMTKAPKELESLDLMNEVRKLDLRARIRREEVETEYGGLVFPMIDLNQQVDITWLKSAYTMQGSKKWSIVQALQQTKFRMNEVGARAESAVALGMRCLSMQIPKPPLMIDEPFFLWIAREGLTMPLFAGYLTPDDWKDPKTLGDAEDSGAAEEASDD